MNTEQNEFLTAALQYAENGWFVFPLKPKSKMPLTAHGFKDASNDPEQIRQWWRQWPNANVAIATGKVSGLFVVDIDGEYPDWFPDLPVRATVSTGRGLHYYFNYPEDREIPARGKLNKAAVDIKSDGGYIVAPPSIHPEGGRYELITE